ncbi:MAG: SUMF1/EgtB/PvdO family nonheme iron enzyme [Elusimicrobia bacterium]|nr:SUMF1/EgtB/PvdO family nonheme iron enzyme [Elusimicrobiota bacterium]
MSISTLLLALAGALAAALGQEASWPDMTQPAKAVGGGEHDAAVVVGVEDYAFVADVPGAESNAKAWYDYLTETRGLPAQNVKFLTGVDATREEMLTAVRSAAGKAGTEGTLWFVFIGHGAPSKDGKDGLLVAVDAQQKAATLQERSLKRSELLGALATSRAGSIRVVLDACFSGRLEDGGAVAPGLQPLVTVSLAGPADPRMVVLTAAKGNQFAGALPGAKRPAFSYLVLGGLRGWAGKATVTAGDLWRYATNALEATLRGRDQTPDLMGREDAVVGPTAGEKGPNLAGLAKATAGAGAQDEMFRVSNLPAVPKAQAPKVFDLGSSGLDLRNIDVDALEKYNDAFKFDKGGASPEDKAETWRSLAKDAPKYAAIAAKRAADWDRYAAAQKAAEQAKQERIGARDSDWAKLSRLLAMEAGVMPAADKARWSGQFVAAFLQSPGLDPEMARDLAPHVAPGSTKETLAKLAKTAPAPLASTGKAASGSEPSRPPSGKASAAGAGIQWERIPGGTFTMGADDWSDTKPRHSVTVKSFQLAKTEVTNKQYRACVDAGACAPAHVSDGSCYVWTGSKWEQGSLPSSFQGDDQPVLCVDWNQAKAFAAWVGGRLPSEVEWEYAARSTGKERRYPWGDEEPSCERAVMDQGGLGCGRNSTWPVCSKTAGNTEQGLCDMAGNVWEWTQDWYHDSYNGAPTDGSAWESPTGSNRVNRGGSWDGGAGDLRTANRRVDDPGNRGGLLGVRVAR